jgi:dihydroorotate dehydrogenase electron transfer subunit
MPAAKVLKVEGEGAGAATITLEAPSIAVRARPGQFVMVWPQGGEEVPMSLSSIRPPRFISITVRAVGDTTRLLTCLRPGDVVGLRGPYGRGFTVAKLKAILVGGGIGVAPLAPLAEELRRAGGWIHALIAAPTSSQLLFKERLGLMADELSVATDDGSEGFKGLAHEALDALLSTERVDRVYVCGPELMIAKCVEVACRRGVDLEASLERYIKCGVGLCGSCAIDGFRVCRDGPVFKLAELAKMRELGLMERDASGRRRRIA